MSIAKITIRQAAEALPVILNAGLIPNLLGSPAIGKSAIVKTIADLFNLKLLDVRASGLLPEDINGMGCVVDGEAKFLPFTSKFPTVGTLIPNNPTTNLPYNGWLLFLDELTNASREVQAALYQLLLDRAVGDYPLHPDVFIVCAGNRVSDRAAANAMGTALQSRVVTLDVEPSLDEWLDDVAFPRNFDSRLTSFLLSNRDMFLTFSPIVWEELTFSAPRTLDMLNALLTEAKLDPISELAFPIMCGTVGSDAAARFRVHCSTVLQLPPISKIIADPFNLPMPEERAQVYGVVMSCLSYINRNTPNHEIEAITHYLLRSPSPSYLVVYGRLVTARNPVIEQLPVWNDLRIKLAQALTGN